MSESGRESGGPLQRLDGDRLARIDGLVEKALEAPEEDRETLLDRLCPGDAELRDEARLLLQSCDAVDRLDDTGDPLAEASARAVSSALEEETGLESGLTLGPYRVIREIGRGGMGIVYEAERADGRFERTVALKLLKRGLDTEEVVRRFEQERRILAGLEHPAIARLLDADETPDGRPYLVMESVQGVPLDRHCDEKRLSIRERLDLLLQVVDAVSHAHRNLVVHRDLKPGNILVTDDGRPKLLDFGIAKLADPAAGGMETRTSLRLLTPRYASPEQVTGATVTTATDVYQLGLLLCDLLVGSVPERLDETTVPDAPLRITALLDRERTEETANLQSLAAARRTTPRRLRRRLRGDLETVVAVATHPDPARRYGTAKGLADDVRRHLSGQPLEGRRDSFAYRFGKIVARHPYGSAAAALLVFLSVAYAVTATAQGRRLAAERDRARAEAVKLEQVKEVLTDLLKTGNPHHRLRGESVAEILERGRRRVDGLADPEVQAELLATLGEIYANRGELGDARECLERSLERRDEILGPDDPTTLHSANLLASVYIRSGELAAAETLLNRVLEERKRQLGPEHNTVGQVLQNLGMLDLRRGDLEAAERQLSEALRINELSLGADHPEVALTLISIGSIYGRQGRYGEAEEALGCAAEIYRKGGEALLHRTGSALHELGTLLHRQGKRAGAREHYEQALKARESSLGPDHYELSSTLNNLGLLLADLGDYEIAAARLEEALRLKRSVLGDDHPGVASTLVNLAGISRELGQPDEAEALYADARRIRSLRFGDDHISLISVDGGQGELALDRGRLDQAEAHFRDGLERAQRHGREESSDAEMLAAGLARVQLARGRPAEAETQLRAVLDRVLQRAGPDTLEAADVRLDLARSLHRQGRAGDAGREAGLALAVLDEQAPPRAARARSQLQAEGLAVDPA